MNKKSYIFLVSAITILFVFSKAEATTQMTFTSPSGTITGAEYSGNAAKVGGLFVHSGTNNEANKIVRTDANGYINAGWINIISGDNGTTALDRIYASNDGYLRYYTPANFRTVLDVPTRGGSGASGTWPISITGSAGSSGSVNASNVSMGTFGSNTGGGSYTFANGVQGNLYERLGTYNTRIVNPMNGYRFTRNGTETGAIAIALPTKVSDTMISFWIDVYDYSDNTTFTAYVSGYPYSSAGLWSNTSALIIGSNANRNYNIRFGGSNDNSKSIIYIGEANSTWSYPQITIRDVMAGYDTTAGEIDNLPWSVTFETTLLNVNQTRANNFPYADWNRIINKPSGTFITSDTIGAQSVSYANSAGSASWATYHSAPDGDRSNWILPTTIVRGVRYDFKNASVLGGTVGNYIGLMTYSPYDGTSASTGDSSYQIAFGSTVANGGEPRLAIRNGVNSTWNSWREILTSANFNSYSPTLTGTGATGTWNISITGSAGATTAVPASNVSAGQFGSNVGNGNFSFPGNVGIGTTAPGAKLEVAGNTRIGSGTFSSFGALNVNNGNGSVAIYRDIDLWGAWAAGEGHAITAPHGSTAADIVGQIVFRHDSPGQVYCSVDCIILEIKLHIPYK